MRADRDDHAGDHEQQGHKREPPLEQAPGIEQLLLCPEFFGFRITLGYLNRRGIGELRIVGSRHEQDSDSGQSLAQAPRVKTGSNKGKAEC